MPLYFFAAVNGTPEPDDEGTDYPDREAARRAAIIYLGQRLRDDPDLLDANSRFSVTLTDEALHPLCVIETVQTLCADGQ